KLVGAVEDVDHADLLQWNLPAAPEHGQCPEVQRHARPEQGKDRRAESVILRGCAGPGREDDRRRKSYDGHPPQDERLMLGCRVVPLASPARHQASTFNARASTSIWMRPIVPPPRAAARHLDLNAAGTLSRSRNGPRV